MRARRGDFERALGGFLPLYLFQIGAAARWFGLALFRCRQAVRALQMIEQADKIGRGDHINPAGPARLRPLCGRADQAFALSAGMKRGQQHTGRWQHAAIQRQFAHRHIIGDLFKIHHAHCRQQRQRHGQIIV